jgi:hypothetical protein
MLLSCKTVPEQEVVEPQVIKPKKELTGDFTIQLSQYEKNVGIKNHKAFLKRDEFNLIINTDQNINILVNIWTGRDSFMAAKADIRFQDIPGFTHTGMAEGLFNKGNYFFPQREAPHYWFYENQKAHRFNEVQIKGETKIATRTIGNIYINSEKQIHLSNYKIKELYIVLINIDPDKNEELDREYVHILFR